MMILRSEKVKNILMIDIPTYKVDLPDLHRDLLDQRLRYQSVLFEERIGVRLIRPGLTYSRGFLTLAACVERSGFSVKYVVHSDPFDRTQILDLAKEIDVVCVSIITPTLNIAKSILADIKNINKKCISIVGGPHINSVFGEVLLESEDFDVAMIGESENRLPELLKNIKTPEKIPGVAYREDGIVKQTDLNIEVINVPEVPPPAYHLLSRPLSEYAHNIKTVRGCPYKCSFCAERQTWNSIHSSSHGVKNIIDEIKLVASQLKPNTLIHFSDAIFNLNWDYASEIVERLQIETPHIKFSCDTRVDLIRSEHVHSLYKANFVCLRMGFESIHNNILDVSEKASTSQRQELASNIIREVSSKIAIHAYIVTGLPGTTRDSLSLDAIQIPGLVKSKIVDIVGNKILVPYPGTPFHTQAEKYGVNILTKDWKKYDRRSYPTYELQKVTADEIYFGYLHQEAALLTAYKEAVGGGSSKINEDGLSLDYIYTNYALKTS